MLPHHLTTREVRFTNPVAYLGPPPVTVPIEHLGEYLYQRRLQAVRCYLNSRREFVVEVVDRPPAPITSAEMEAAHATE